MTRFHTSRIVWIAAVAVVAALSATAAVATSAAAATTHRHIAGVPADPELTIPLTAPVNPLGSTPERLPARR